jgi:bifunctional UDP-N-acetylglucosamine pyrophosphorylase / glucosamine-1-phosphate N-acetyltransferase
MSSHLAAVVMAAGLGTRMKSAVPKHLHPLLGQRVVDWVLDAAGDAGCAPVVVVASPDTQAAYADRTVAVQDHPRGTGDAVAAAESTLAGFEGRVLVLDAAAPLLAGEHFRALVEEHEREGAAVTLLSFEPDTPLPYGRVIRAADGGVREIVEDRDATPEQRAVRELNSSIYVFESTALWPAVARLEAHNAQGELYLTDTIAHIVAAGGRAAAYRCPDPIAPLGVNTRAELAVAGAVLRERLNERHMLAGVTIVDPATTWIDAGVAIEPDALIHPFTVLRGATRIAAGAEIGPHAVAVDAEVGPGATVGPFCYLRPGTVLEEQAKAGTFVEIKNSRIGRGAKVPHQSYIGDADVGEGTNVGAGAITANFPHQPGRPKGRTTIGRNVRTGVQNAFIAPVTIGDEAWVAAGSVITNDVPPRALAVARQRQVNKEGYVGTDGND